MGLGLLAAHHFAAPVLPVEQGVVQFGSMPRNWSACWILMA